ncbi:ATP-binding cassette sub- G member 1 [Chytridiales sp. JEL 0842]|nr:ATP-binding cassette sub- G member 1 [Chytridiales sp. JEL 0842]
MHPTNASQQTSVIPGSRQRQVDNSYLPSPTSNEFPKEQQHPKLAYGLQISTNASKLTVTNASHGLVSPVSPVHAKNDNVFDLNKARPESLNHQIPSIVVHPSPAHSNSPLLAPSAEFKPSKRKSAPPQRSIKLAKDVSEDTKHDLGIVKFDVYAIYSTRPTLLFSRQREPEVPSGVLTRQRRNGIGSGSSFALNRKRGGRVSTKTSQSSLKRSFDNMLSSSSLDDGLDDGSPARKKRTTQPKQQAPSSPARAPKRRNSSNFDDLADASSIRSSSPEKIEYVSVSTKVKDNYIPPISEELLRKYTANKSPCGQMVTWAKNGPIYIDPASEGYEQLADDEIQVCSILRLPPTVYLKIKETLVSARHYKGTFKKRDAQKWCRVDVNKTGKVFDWFIAKGWLISPPPGRAAPGTKSSILEIEIRRKALRIAGLTLDYVFELEGKAILKVAWNKGASSEEPRNGAYDPSKMPNRLPPRELRSAGDNSSSEGSPGITTSNESISASTHRSRGNLKGGRSHNSLDANSKRMGVSAEALQQDSSSADPGKSKDASNQLSKKVMFGSSREMLGSSFQISHVVKEDPEEESKEAPLPPKLMRRSLPEIAAATERKESGPMIVVISDEAAAEEKRKSKTKRNNDDNDGGVRESPWRKVDVNPISKVLSASDFSLCDSTDDIYIDAVGSLKPEDRMELQFKNLTYAVPIETTTTELATGRTVKVVEDKYILKGVSGALKPGRLTAIMGASGAGKTSLLNILSGETQQYVGGTMSVNSEPITGSQIKEISGFVFQDDVLLPTMTVKEAIQMSALLRLPSHMTPEERQQRVKEVVRSLTLDRALNTIIGDSQIKGVSGGERKRCAIAMEMITKPAIMFLDEPTSGLDSFTALSVMRTLKALAGTGRAVVATIHQPSSEIFRIFDDFILMADGRIMYQGPADQAVKYFARLGYECPKTCNPADYFFMSILNQQEMQLPHAPKDNISPQERIQRLLGAWERSSWAQEILRKIVHSKRTGGITDNVIQEGNNKWAQLKFLYGRAAKNTLRNPLIIRNRIIQISVMTTFVGLLYLNTDQKEGLSAFQNRIGVLFFCSAQNLMAASTSNLTVFSREKPVFLREYGAGYYGITVYFLSKLAAELPLYIVFPSIQAIFLVYLVGLQKSAAQILIFMAFNSLTSICGMSVGICFACQFDSTQAALAVTPLVIMPFMLFSGMFININKMPAWLGWLQYVSPIKYCFEGLVKNEFIGLRVFQPAQPPLYKNDTWLEGESQIELLGLRYNNLDIWVCIVILIATATVFMSVAYMSLRHVALKKKGRKSQSLAAAHAANKKGQVTPSK